MKLAVGAFLSIALLTSCGGGGGGESNPPANNKNNAPEFSVKGSDVNIAAGSQYLLEFDANDADGDSLQFSISALPDWLSFSAQNKTLSGSPGYLHVGQSFDLTLTISDGQASVDNHFTLSVSELTPDNQKVHRLLLHTSFGPTAGLRNSIAAQGMVAWVDQQLNMSSAYDSNTDNWKTHLERTIEYAQMAEPSVAWYATSVFNETIANPNVAKYQMSAWLENALGSTAAGFENIGSDQLRQRVAYALSQLIVVSALNAPLNERAEGVAHFYDLLAQNAFGNYRDLLDEITRSPAMGVYLSHMGNAKASVAAGTRPDENFAREVMQLFSIGLYMLNLDGSPDRDANPSTYPDAGSTLVPSYTQDDVEELAKVMTGWDLVANDSYGRQVTRDGDYTQQMEFTAAFHEDEVEEGGDGNVTLLGNTFALSAGADSSGLDAALDVLFQHQNSAPYVSNHLIQRLVTSNPSSSYIARVAAVFDDNGNNVKGDLKAVIRAILLDDEARGDKYLTDSSYGKAKEPLLAYTQLIRAADVTTFDGWLSKEGVAMDHVYWLPFPQAYLAYAPMRSPSVFNFYNPDFVPSDTAFSSQNLVGPEFQVQSDQMLVSFDLLSYVSVSTYERTRLEFVYGPNPTPADEGLNYIDNIILTTSINRALVKFEMGMEGDSNGDYSLMADMTTDADGDRPKANGVDAVLVLLDDELLGNTMPDDYRAALKHYLVEAASTSQVNKVVSAWSLVRDAYRLVATSSLYMIQK